MPFRIFDVAKRGHIWVHRNPIIEKLRPTMCAIRHASEKDVSRAFHSATKSREFTKFLPECESNLGKLQSKRPAYVNWVSSPWLPYMLGFHGTTKRGCAVNSESATRRSTCNADRSERREKLLTPNATEIALHLPLEFNDENRLVLDHGLQFTDRFQNHVASSSTRGGYENPHGANNMLNHYGICKNYTIRF